MSSSFLIGALFLVPSLALDEPYIDYLAQFRAVAPATLGCLVLATLIPLIVYFARRQGAYLLPDLNPGELESFLVRVGLLSTTLILMVCGFFHFFGTEWLVAYQTVFFACIGFYALWVQDADHLQLYGYLSLFNWFCVSGRLAFLGYSTALSELTTQSCNLYFYFGPDVLRCGGAFINFQRLLGLVVIFFQALAIYLAYRAYKLALNSRGSSRYESIKEATPDARLAQPYQASAMNFGGIAVSTYSGHPSDLGEHSEQMVREKRRGRQKENRMF